MSKETESQWRANLDEARGRLSEIRETLILSWLKIHSADNKRKRIFLGKGWGEAVREEVAITEDVIAPAKIELGLPLTNSNQERRVKRRAGKTSETHGGTYKQGVSVVKRHIGLAKKIQKRAGLM